MYKQIFALLLLLGSILKAQSSGVIYGNVMDESGFPAGAADVFIDGTIYSAFTDEDGNYEMEVEPGTYNVVITAVGYDETVQSITVNDGERIEFSTALKTSNESTTQLGEAVVVGQMNKETESALLSEQRKALDMKQAIGAEELSRKGVGDAASAVTKTTGVAKQEGVKNVFVRGLGDRYNSTSMNGLPLPSEDPEYKNIALEFFTTDIIKNVNINKTFGANIYSDVGGANIDIASKELDKKSLFTVSAGNGYNTNLKGHPVLVADETTYFGFPKNGVDAPITDLQQYDFKSSFKPWARDHVFNTDFGLMAGGKIKFENNNTLSLFGVLQNNSEFLYTDGVVRFVNSAGGFRQDMKLQESSYKATQTFLGNIKYGFGSGRSIAVNSLYIHDSHQTVGDYKGFYASVNDNDFATNSFVRRQQTNDNNLFVNQLLFDYKFSEKINLNLSGTYNLVKGSEPDRKTNSYDYDYNGDAGYVIATNSPALNHRFFSTLDEDDYAGKFEINYNFNPGAELVKTLTIGANYRNTERTFEATQFNFDFNSPLAVDINNPDALFNQYYLDLGKNNGGFDLITGWGSNPDTAFDPFYYIGERTVLAGYAQLTFPFSDKFTALVGGRFESVEQTVNWHTNLSSSVNDLTVEEGKIKEDFILPSLNLKYSINDDNILRFAASRTYTLPQFKETAPFLYEGVNRNDIGNPYLIASDNLNFDLKYDWYLSRKEIISVGGFYKMIQDPINRIRIASAANEFSFVNTDDAFVAGAEFEGRKIIYSNDGELNKQDFSFGLNVSYLYSEQTLNDSDRDELTVHFSKEKDKLEGASPLLVNSDLSYNISNDRVDFTTTVVFNYFYNKIFSLGTGGNENIVEKGVPTLDFVNKIQFKKSRIGLSLSAKNILNPEYKLTQQTSAGDITVESFKKGIFLDFGIHWTM